MMIESVVGGADLLGVVGEARQQRRRGVAVEVADRQHAGCGETRRGAPGYDVPADIAHEVVLGEVAGAAQDEQAHQRERHPDDGARILVREGAVAELLGEQREAGHGEREQDPAEDPEHEVPAVGARCSRAAAGRTRRLLAGRRAGAPLAPARAVSFKACPPARP